MILSQILPQVQRAWLAYTKSQKKEYSPGIGMAKITNLRCMIVSNWDYGEPDKFFKF